MAIRFFAGRRREIPDVPQSGDLCKVSTAMIRDAAGTTLAAGVQTEGRSRMSPKPTKVLIVEDNPGDARLLAERLLDAPAHEFDLPHAVRLKDALQHLLTQEFDVILLDLTLPDSAGLDTVVRIREAAVHTAIVVLTSVDDETLATEAMRKGAQDYLVKGETDRRWLTRSMRYAMEREQLVEELQEALATVKSLSGLLPICAWCKKIRDDKGYWTQVEQYINDHSEAQFTHAICPDCAHKMYASQPHALTAQAAR